MNRSIRIKVAHSLLPVEFPSTPVTCLEEVWVHLNTADAEPRLVIQIQRVGCSAAVPSPTVRFDRACWLIASMRTNQAEGRTP